MSNMDIIITGAEGSGKTSIKKVVFEKKSPHERVFNDHTEKNENLSLESLGCCKLSVTEFPSSYSFEDSNEESVKYLKNCGVLLFIIDSQEQTNPQYEYFKNNILPIFGKHQNISLAIFIHKIYNVSYGQNDKNNRSEIQVKFQEMLTQFKKEANINDIKHMSYSLDGVQIYTKTFIDLLIKIVDKYIVSKKMI